MNIDIRRSLTYALEDQRWASKLWILVLIGFIPGLNVIVWGGYALTIARRIMQRERLPLPEWDEWSEIAIRGLLSITATVIYFLPVILLLCILAGIQLFLGGNGGRAISAIQFCAGAAVLVYGLAAGLLINAGHVHFVVSDQFSDYFDIGRRLYELRTNLDVYVPLFLFETVLSLIAAALTALLGITCVGLVIVPSIAFLANGFALGAAAREMQKRERPGTLIRG